jgi:enoyl-CoA hydratase/carnithine racemase
VAGSNLVRLERVAPGVGLLVLSNPPLNLVTLDLTRALEQVLEEIASDEEIRVLVVTGVGEKAFCAGSDIKEFPSLRARNRVIEDKLDRENRVYDQLEDLPQPTIAAIRGLALGGGLELALCCDFRLVGDTARLGVPEVKLGVFPGSGGLYRLPRAVGESRAKRLMFTGDFVGAAEAERIGLADEVVPDGEVLGRAERLAEQLAERPQPALRAIKAGVRETAWVARERALQRSLELSRHVFSTPEAGEGVAAFLEKRQPDFNSPRRK